MKESEERKARVNQIVHTSAFSELMRRKTTFIVSAFISFMVLYLPLPILAGFTTILNGRVIGALPWVWVYAYATLIMMWVICHLYLSRASRWDALVERVRQEDMATKQEDAT